MANNTNPQTVVDVLAERYQFDGAYLHSCAFDVAIELLAKVLQVPVENRHGLLYLKVRKGVLVYKEGDTTCKLVRINPGSDGPFLQETDVPIREVIGE